MLNFLVLNTLARSRRVCGTATRSLWAPYQSRLPVILNLPFLFVFALSMVCQPSAHLTCRCTKRRLRPLALPLIA